MYLFWSGFLMGLGLALFFCWAAISRSARVNPGPSLATHPPRALSQDEIVTRVVRAPQAPASEVDDPSLAPVEKTTKIRMDEMQILLERARSARRKEDLFGR